MEDPTLTLNEAQKAGIMLITEGWTERERAIYTAGVIAAVQSAVHMREACASTVQRLGNGEKTSTVAAAIRAIPLVTRSPP